MKLKVADKEYELSTALRVVYALREISHAKNLQDAVGSIATLDLDGQLELLYAAYKAGEGRKNDVIPKAEFIDEILDNLGIYAITQAINKLADGLLYSGLSPEDVASKKAQMEVAIAKATATGAASSVEDTN